MTAPASSAIPAPIDRYENAGFVRNPSTHGRVSWCGSANSGSPAERLAPAMPNTSTYSPASPVSTRYSGRRWWLIGICMVGFSRIPAAGPSPGRAGAESSAVADPLGEREPGVLGLRPLGLCAPQVRVERGDLLVVGGVHGQLLVQGSLPLFQPVQLALKAGQFLLRAAQV